VQFDKHQSFNDQPLSRCPECGKKSLKKVYQPVGIVFKGSGFYATDHHSPSGQQHKKDEKSPEIKGDSAAEKKDGGENKEISAKPENTDGSKE
jgi:putative FmdB family regulatory protein